MRARRHLPARGALAAALLAAAARARAQPPAPADTAVRVRLGAFVDAYYAYDAGRPPARDRAFAGGALFGTQPARHSEFNVNLAFAEAVLDGPGVRGRLAVQFGTSVQANYAAEPRQGQVSGPGVQQYLQEATAGLRVAPRLWVDGGIFFSHLGMESWVSRENPTYTRSLVADYSPYYSTGVKLTYAAAPRLTARLDVVNGWQTISESNAGKGAGLRLDYALTPAATLSAYNYVGEEAGTRLRTFQGLGARAARGPVSVLAQADVGTQRRPPGRAGASTWYGLLGVVRGELTRRVALAGRVERYSDPDQVIVATGAPAAGAPPNPAFRATGASLGVDVQPRAGGARALWRTEVRAFRARDPVFPGGRAARPRRDNALAVTSLALTF